MDFSVISKAVSEQFQKMSKYLLLESNVNKYELWDMYLASFPEGTNPMYLTNTEHDCNCCKSFIRQGGNALAYIDGELTSIWDINIGGFYQEVADELSAMVKSEGVKGIYLSSEKHLGKDFTLSHTTGVKHEHFNFTLPSNVVVTDGTIAAKRGKAFTNKQVLERSLKEISTEAIEIVTDLISQGSLYKGTEFKSAVNKLNRAKSSYLKHKDNGSEEEFLWTQSVTLGEASNFRNTMIGTLLVDLSEGVDLEVAVKKYEEKAAPQNYMRTTALITERMKEQAYETVVGLGLEDSLHRRFAEASDITINNVLFADNSVRKSLGAFDVLGSARQKPIEQKLDNVEVIGIDDFIKNVLPRVDSIDMLVDNAHTGNLTSLIAPIHPNAGNILKWDNNFSYSYNGEVTDSMKQRVKSAGGNVDGELRFSIQWNDGDNNQNDFDAHCHEPDGNEIYFGSKSSRKSGGKLDVDIQDPGSKVAVENITWAKSPTGKHVFTVVNYSDNGGTTGFTAEIEHKGVIHSFVYDKKLKQGECVVVAEVDVKSDGLVYKKSLPHTKQTKTVWGIETEQFNRVSMVMHSPNHWDGQKVGNKHVFFMLEGCANPDSARGFYNEFLRPELHEHRKVFEVLGSRLKTAHAENQLSGLGFSETKRDSIIVKVRGSFNRTLKINF